jgi:Holliday junction resolvase RusA-like endonuclease
MEYDEIIFPIVPFPKPRMTQRDKWKKRPVVVKYHLFKDGLKHYACENKYEVGCELSLTFVMPFPKSYSKKKKESLRGKPHQIRPDLDNLVKAFKDALCLEDSYVYKYNCVQKIWGDEGKIIIKEPKNYLDDTSI